MKHENVDLSCRNYPNWGSLVHPNFHLIDRKDFHGFEVHCQTDPNTIGYLLESINGIKNGKFVEIGVFGGWVSLHLAEAASKSNSQLYSIDVWEKLEIGNGSTFPESQLLAARYYMHQLRLNYENILDQLGYSHAHAICDSSIKAVEQFEDGSLDLIFIDGEHDKEHLYNELSLWYPKLKEGGTFSGDDYTWPGLSEAIHRFGDENGLICSNPVDTNRGIWNLR